MPQQRTAQWDQPVSAAGPALFRIAFGLLLFVAMLRLLISGWIATFFDQHAFHFTYRGFSWISALPLPATYALVASLAVFAMAIALGFYYRACTLLFFLGFSYLELIDVTNYLNHYYLVALLTLLLAVTPLHCKWSLDARRNPKLARQVLPVWVVWLFRLQIGVVYFYAGLAKLNSDWLLHAQPLNLWLTARSDTPVVGKLLAETWLHYAFSWMAFFFDTTVVAWLSWRRSRAIAYAVLLAFHAMTHLFFNIGLFPFIMSIAAWWFFDPAWPYHLVGYFRNSRSPTSLESSPAIPSSRVLLGFLICFAIAQVLLPLRHFFYGGDVSWHEQGMRWAWKVMLREKHGSVTFFVGLPNRIDEVQVSPGKYLDSRQEREMAGQPDLILQLAHHIANDFRAQGYGEVRVRAEVLVSLNGRPPRYLLDPTRDLARVEDGLAAADWILPKPDDEPSLLRTAHR